MLRLEMQSVSIYMTVGRWPNDDLSTRGCLFTHKILSCQYVESFCGVKPYSRSFLKMKFKVLIFMSNNKCTILIPDSSIFLFMCFNSIGQF